MRKKGFTLIELIAVLVIMAILALIVTPLIISIIRKVRISSDKHSIDAYGRSIELAIAGYLLDNGYLPTSVEQLTIEYSGPVVECSTTQINTDSSVYLEGCTVDGRSVDGYTYGEEEIITYEAYEIGDEVSYNNVDYYVIEDSSASEANVTLLKKTPLTVAEVNQYGGVGTANNHVNMYVTSDTSSSYYQTANNQNGYGGMAYYTSETCGVINDSEVTTGCITDYAQSEVKYVVDAWKSAEAPLASEARLITTDDLMDNLGYEWLDETYEEVFGESISVPAYYEKTESSPNWVYNSYYKYWTMSHKDDSTIQVWYIYNRGSCGESVVKTPNGVVRPVIVLPKSALN